MNHIHEERTEGARDLKATLIHLNIRKEVEAPEGLDMRTREGRDAEVLAQVGEFGGFDVWWPMDNLKRCYALERMEMAGLIISVPGSGFPWCGYRLPIEGEPIRPIAPKLTKRLDPYEARDAERDAIVAHLRRTAKSLETLERATAIERNEHRKGGGG